MSIRESRPDVSREVKAVAQAGGKLERATHQLALAYQGYATALSALERKTKRRLPRFRTRAAPSATGY